MSSRHFTPALFAFLRDLAQHNDRAWFQENKQRYVDDVQEPALAFIADFAEPLRRISPHFRADARVQGGSLFRIYRDTRFSKDKTPFKTNTGVHFRHERAKDVHAPGYYLHLEPGGCYAGVGLWLPEAAVARQIRQAIVDDPDGWRRATRSRPFTEVWELAGDSLRRPPRGFDPDHRFVEDLKRRSFIATCRLTQREVTSSGFSDALARRFRAATPFMRFLCRAIDVEF